MNTVYRKKKDSFYLDGALKDMVIGSLLGDANLNRRGNNCRLSIKHGLSGKQLLEWKYQLLLPITTMPINYFQQSVKNKTYQFGQFVSLTHPSFTTLYNLFYPAGKKIVPTNIGNLFVNPLSLAVWIMDDGAKEHVGLSLQTHSFTPKDILLLQAMLQKNFNLLTTIRRNRGSYVLYFPKSEMIQLKRLTYPFILPEYYYKFP